MKWVLDNPARFLSERAELERLEAEVDWLTTVWRIDAEGIIEVDLDMVVHGRTYAARMTYPDVFPNSPPYIRPRNSSERWTSHQYGTGGSLCLQWRADNWQTHVTGVELVRDAFELLCTEQHPEQPSVVPSAHRITEGQSMAAEVYRFVGTNGFIGAARNLPMQSWAVLKTHSLLNATTIVTFISEISPTGGTAQAIPDLPSGISTYYPLFALKGDGWILRSKVFDTAPSIASLDDLTHTLSEAGFEPSTILEEQQDASKYTKRLIVLVGADPGLVRVYSVESGDQPRVRKYAVIMPSDSGRLPDESEQLSNVRIGIVGLGSIGSKVAISLARSGVRRFLLVDDDYLVPGNLVRHDLSWAFVGVHKVNAVKDALCLVAPGLDVDVRTQRVAGQESALNAAAALKDLSSCDLLIDATANPEVFLRLASVARTYKKPLCWGELFAGGYGGLIARARPSSDPNPLAVRSAIHVHLASLPPAPYKQVDGYDVLTDDEPLVAYDCDVTQIAAALTAFVVDAAIQRAPSAFPYSAYLIGLRHEWIFEQPFDTRPIDVSGEGWDTEGPAVTEDRVAALKALLELHAETQNANSSNPQ